MTLTVLFGDLSAIFRFASALVPVPRNVWFQAHVGGGGPNQEFEKLLSGLKRQSHLNRCGAFFTAAMLVTQMWGAS